MKPAIAIDGGRTCTRCGTFAPLSDFPKDKRKKLGRAAQCKRCVVEYQRAYRKTAAGNAQMRAYGAKYRNSAHGAEKIEGRRKSTAHRVYMQKYHVKHTFGLDDEDWARLFHAQNGKCPVCESDLPFDRRTVVDHCHITGKVRGLLHSRCNTLIGLAGDKPDSLRRAIIYLEGFSFRGTP